MNSIILRRSRFLLNLLPQRQQLFFIPIPTLSSFFPAFPLPLDDLKQLLSPWLRAVPKSKTSHSKKKMRSSNKGLKEQQGIVACPSCGAAKRAHHLCHSCHIDFRQTLHRNARENSDERGITIRNLA